MARANSLERLYVGITTDTNGVVSCVCSVILVVLLLRIIQLFVSRPNSPSVCGRFANACGLGVLFLSHPLCDSLCWHRPDNCPSLSLVLNRAFFFFGYLNK